MERNQNLKIWGSVFAFNGAVALFLFLILNKLPPEIPLFYGKPTGEEQLATKYVFFLPLLITSLIGVLNFLFSQFVANKFIKNVFLGIFMVLTILSVITIFKIVFLVGNIF